MIEYNIRNRALPMLIWVDDSSRVARSMANKGYSRAWKIYQDVGGGLGGDAIVELKFQIGYFEIYGMTARNWSFRSHQELTVSDDALLEEDAPTLLDAIVFDQMIKRWIHIHGSLMLKIYSASKPSTKRVFKLK